MNRLAAWVVAEVVSVFHAAWTVVLLIGWLFPPPYYFMYVGMVCLTFLSQFVLRYCVLTPVEFYFRRLADPSIGQNSQYLWYYTQKYFPDAVSETFVDRVSLVFLSVSILAAALRLSGYW